MAQIDKALQMAVQARASDLHLATGNTLIIRQFGKLKRVKSGELSAEAAKKLIYEILTPEQREKLEKELQLDFSYDLEGLARFRGNAILQRKGIDATFRIIPLNIPTLDQLGLPPVVKKFCDFTQGMILVTGATGQGKTTTLASLVDHINSSRPVHILTIEDPIEFVHPVKMGVVNQRQLGKHTLSFGNALKASLREDPNVVMVGELRDLETVELAVHAAETGFLVMGTLSTSSAPKTITKLIDSFPPEAQNQIRTMVAVSLRAVISQKLIPRADGKGMVMAAEILIGTAPIANLIRTEKVFQIPSMMTTGRGIGMQLMDDSILVLYKEGKITEEDALSNVENRRAFEQKTRK